MRGDMDRPVPGGTSYGLCPLASWGISLWKDVNDSSIANQAKAVLKSHYRKYD